MRMVEASFFLGNTNLQINSRGLQAIIGGTTSKYPNLVAL